MSKKIICALLAFVLLIGLMPVSAIPASAAEAQKCGRNLTWNYDKAHKTLRITGTGAMDDFESNPPWAAHASEIETLDLSSDMTSIGKNAFNQEDFPNLHTVKIWDISNWCHMKFNGVNPLSFAHNLYLNGKLVRHLVIPDGTYKINPRAFEGASIQSLEISGDVQYIGRNAFAGCQSLNSVSIHNGVEFFKESVFENCTALTSITIPSSVTSIEEGCFRGCTKLSTVNVGSNLNYIGNEAFKNTAVKSMILPDKLHTLGAGAFENCKNLEEVRLSYGMTRLEDRVFNGCSALKDIWICNSIKYVGPSTFSGCTGLKAVYTDDLYGWCLIDFAGINPLQYAHRLYEDKLLLKDLIIPDKATVIKKNAFKGWTDLSSVRIPDFLHTIEAGAFDDCTGIKNVYVSTESRWASLKKNIADEGNEYLKNDKKVSFDDSLSKDPEIPSAGVMDVNEHLVDLVISMHSFSDRAYETYEGSGKYLIGYGTPANKGDVISRSDARNTLREYLRQEAAQVNKVFSSKVTAEEREALTAFCHFNGYNWMYNNSVLYTAVNNGYTGTKMLNAFCSTSNRQDDAALKSCLAEADLYLNQDYEAGYPDNYGYVVLDPNGGTSAGYGRAIGYNKNETTYIDSAYAPSRIGFEFKGWYTSSKNGSGKLITTLDQTTENRVLYAHWQKHDAGLDDDGKIVGRKVNYQLPAYVADAKDSTGRIKLYANPEQPEDGLHIATVEPNAVVSIEREYRHPITGDLWVKVRNSGWMNLGGKNPDDVKAVEVGTVKLDLKKRLPVYDDAGNEKTVSLRNGDRVAVYARKTNDNVTFGKTVVLDTSAHKTVYTEGWVDLAYITFDGTINGNQTPEENDDDYTDTPTGKAPITYGVVVNTDNLNVRSAPNVYGQFYCKLPRGTEVNIYDMTTTNGVRWALLDQGWASMQYIHETENTTPDAEEEENKTPANPGDVGTDDNTTPLAKGQAMANIALNVRSGPGAQFEKVGTLSSSNRFTIFQTKMSNGVQWGRMEKGWVCMTYVRLDGDITITNPNAGSGGSDANKPAEKPKTLGQGRVVNCSTHVNVRANATPQSALQGTYALNSVIELLEHSTNNGFDWYRTEKGWVCGTYVQKIAAPDVTTPVTPVVPTPGTNPGTTPNVPSNAAVGTITGANNVNVRKGPGVYNAKVTTLRSGSRVNILGTKVVDGHTWYQIDQGWVAGDYVTLGSGAIAGGSSTPVIGGTTETTNGKYATGTIAQAGTKVRAGAGYGYKEVKTLNLGDKVTVYEQQLLDGVAWGRVSNTDWVNLAFVTLDSTGITGTGTLGTIYRCAHAVNVRSTPNVNGARMATLLLGSTVEILETKDTGNGESWGRTPQGWVNMYYVNTTALPVPPLPVPNPNPAPNPAPDTKPAPDAKPEQKPADQGIPFTMNGTMKETANLQMIPGVLGDYDASIAKGQKVHILKLEKADGVLYGMLEAGWLKMDLIQVDTYAVSEKAQLVWADASTTTAVGALNKGELVTIQKLEMDSAKKVWGQIDAGKWIELTAITQPENFSKTFILKGTAKNDAAMIRETPSLEAEQVGDKLAAGRPLIVDGLERDVDGKIWGHVTANASTGWMLMDDISIYTPGKVISKTLIGWKDADRTEALVVMNQGADVTVTSLTLNNVGVPMGVTTVGSQTVYIEISNATIVAN